jgi:xanthine dehydrogenase YagT iron-sulfur-binding subunit
MEEKERTAPFIESERGITRRSFIKGVGLGTAAVATGAMTPGASAEAKVLDADQRHPITLNVNGRSYGLSVEPRWSLLFVLREKLGLTGSKVGCERGECGACTVLINGVARYSCLTLALEAQGQEITTIEGMMQGEALGALQSAFLEKDAYQCGYCTSGQIMAAEGLLRSTPQPSMAEIQRGMSGNLCRCGAYTHIFQAVHDHAKSRERK